jgi:hypothetical protein
MAEYRIRQAVLSGAHYRRKAFIAERKRSFFGLFSFWFPLRDARWRNIKEACKWDIDHDIEMRKPLEAPEFIKVRRNDG